MQNRKFLTDENIPSGIVKLLKEQQYDVKDIKEEKLFGISDYEIFEMALDEKRSIITLDQDFLKLAKPQIENILE